MADLHYKYDASRAYCEAIGLVWLGDEFVRNADADAYLHDFTQEQLDVAMQHHLCQIKFLFTPKNYNFITRILFAFYFLTGWKPKNG